MNAFGAEHPPRLHRRTDGCSRPADHGDRRRDGHGDPAGPAGRGRLPRRPVHGVADRSSGQQRPAHPDAAADHRGDPPRVPRGGRRHPGDQHVQRERGLALRLRHGGAGLRAELRRRCPGPQGRRRVQHPGEAPLRRRRNRADDADRVDLAGRQRPRSPQRLLRPAGRRLPRSRQRPGRRRCRPHHHRDDLRLAERQGGGVRRRDAVRGPRTPLAGDHLGHHHRCFRADVVRSGHRGVLERDQARQADRGRPQLRPGRAGDEALHRRGGADRGHLRLLLPERRPAQRVRRVRRVPGASGRLHRRVRRGRAGQPGRWLLRNGAAAHRRDRQGRRGQAAARAAGDRGGHPALGPGAAQHHRRLPVREHR